MKNNIEIEIIKNFKSKILQNKRNIRVYLPPSYSAQNNKLYPVLYVHDGQNIFTAEESYSGESWQLHQTAEYLIREEMIEEIIIVAVDNMGSERLSEYAHQDGVFKGEKIKARGLKYENFFIKELMPFIEKKYRIKNGPEDTALMGSSMGGLVTFNMGLKRPDLFSKLGVMSPSLWWGKSDAVEKLRSYNYEGLKSKIWLDTGDAEGKFMSFSEEVIAELKNIQSYKQLDLVYYQAADAHHSESAWAARVHSPLLYFFGDVGEIEKIELIGREIIGLREAGIRINPVLTFDSGFKMTALEGEFKSLTPELLEVNENGVLKPKKTGSAEIEFKVFGQQVRKNITIVEQLKEKDIKGRDVDSHFIKADEDQSLYFEVERFSE